MRSEKPPDGLSKDFLLLFIVRIVRIVRICPFFPDHFYHTQDYFISDYQQSGAINHHAGYCQYEQLP